MKESSDFDFMYKILLLGDSMVGKTSFLMRYTDNEFIDNPISTVGLDYKLKYLKLQNEKTIKMQLWDTAGQDKLRAITQNYYKGANGIILMYDITCMRSFNNVRNWLSSINNSSAENIQIILLGNKIDCAELREVAKDEGEKIAKEFGIGFFEVSAKINHNLEKAIMHICRSIYDNIDAENKNKKNCKRFFLFRAKGDGSKKEIKKCCK